MNHHVISPVARAVLSLPARLYDWHAGWLLGDRFLRVSHIGRRSGRCYRTMLEVIGNDRATGEVFVMAGFGASADWYRNVQPHGATEVAVGRSRFQPVHRRLTDIEAAAVLGAYERGHRLVAPLVRRVLQRLVGWPYDGTPASRLRLVRELPVVAFRPSE